MRAHRDYETEILAVIEVGEQVTSNEIARRLGVARNYLLQDLYQLTLEGKLTREGTTRARGGVLYVYRRAALVPWSEWPSWTLMSDLPFSHLPH